LDVTLRDGALAQAIAAGGERWDKPTLLFGPDAEAEINALLKSAGDAPWRVVRNFRDLVQQRRGEFEFMEGRLDTRFYEHLVGGAGERLAQMLRGAAPFEDLVDFVARGPSGQGDLSRTSVGSDFTNAVERLCNVTGLVLPWQTKGSFLAAFVLAVWVRRPRLYPLVLYSQKRFGVPSGEGMEVPTGGMEFEALADEIQRVFGMNAADVEQAYRVWQLSRAGDTTKPQATTPRTVSREIAKEFLGVLLRARTERQVSIAAAQKPAPLMFELGEGGVGLKHGASAGDAVAIIKAGAASLARRIDRLGQDAHFANVVPSATDIFELSLKFLAKIQGGDYADADVIELGLELNALQWHVDAVQSHLGEISIGELTGLFATANLFLGRFTAWQDYVGATPASGRQEDGFAAFEVSLDLLKAAQDRSAFLTPEANARIGDVLARTPENSAAPPLREGVVRSGENLAAITAEGLSKVVVGQAKELGKKTKEKAFEEASTAIVEYAAKNAPLLLKLGELRKWPWLSWLHHLVQ
jgi:hypothetical protein